MTEDLALLRLLQVFDSQFPVGAFAHSGGIETYAALGGAVPELRRLLQAQIQLGWGRSELGAARLAWDAAGGADDRELHALAQRLDAIKIVPAIREASIGLGRRTADLLRRLYPGATIEISPSHHAVVIGAAARRLGADPRMTLLAYAQSLANGMLAAAMRCMPIAPATAQELLVTAQPLLTDAVDRAIADPESCLLTCTLEIDIRCHQQAQLRTRLFQS